MKRDYWPTTRNSYFWGATCENVWYSVGFKQHLDYFREEPYYGLEENINSYYPRPLLNNTKNVKKQTRYLQDASYIRLKNLQIGYTLPAAFTNRMGIAKLRVFSLAKIFGLVLNYRICWIRKLYLVVSPLLLASTDSLILFRNLCR